jgi:hypothetical protein
LLAFFTALGFLGASLAVSDKRIGGLALIAGVVCWTVFVQDHMSGKKMR